MPGPLTPRQLFGAITRHSERKADVVWGFYLRPDGARGKHIVRLKCSDQEIAAAGPPDQTFKPGTVVGLASNQGGQGKVILAYPPPGGRGSSSFQAEQVRVETPLRDGIGADPAPACPTMITGHSYYGLAMISDDLHLWSYSDGTYVEDVASITLPDLGHSGFAWQGFNTFACPYLIPSTTRLCCVAYYETNGGETIRPALISWDYSGGTVAVYDGLDLNSDFFEMFAYPAGGYIWSIVRVSGTAYLLRFATNLTGGDTPIGSGQSASQDIAVLYAHSAGFDASNPADEFFWHDGVLDLELSDPGRTRIDNTHRAVGVQGTDTESVVSTGSGVATIEPVTGSEVSIFPAHWSANLPYVYIVGGTDLVINSGSTLSRVTYQDYSATSAECAQPTVAVDQHPSLEVAPHALIPID